MRSLAVAVAEGQEALDGHGERTVDLKALRYVADLETGGAASRSGVWAFEAEECADERGLAGAVGADEGQDLAGVDVEVDVGEDGVRPARTILRPRAPIESVRVEGARARPSGRGPSRITVIVCVMAVQMRMSGGVRMRCRRCGRRPAPRPLPEARRHEGCLISCLWPRRHSAGKAPEPRRILHAVRT